MKKDKLFYCAPAAKLLVVRFEDCIMSAEYGDPGYAGDTLVTGEEYNL